MVSDKCFIILNLLLIERPINSISILLRGQNVTGRVVHKSNVRFYEGGKLFTFDVKDDEGEVRITAFQALVDKLYDVVKVSNSSPLLSEIVGKSNIYRKYILRHRSTSVSTCKGSP